MVACALFPFVQLCPSEFDWVGRRKAWAMQLYLALYIHLEHVQVIWEELEVVEPISWMLGRDL